jgi:hypothetical protein
MEENPYKAPETENRPESQMRVGAWRRLGQVVCILCAAGAAFKGTVLLFSVPLGMEHLYREWETSPGGYLYGVVGTFGFAILTGWMAYRFGKRQKP